MSGLQNSPQTRKAKILATLGPGHGNEDGIEALLHAGADVFRLNFSHGSQEDHKKRHAIIRQLEEKVNRPIGILMDLQGPKLRVGLFENGFVNLTPGQAFRLDLNQQPGNEERVELPHPEIFDALRPGMELLLDDGRVRLNVVESGSDYAETTVVFGSKLSNQKGVNVPGAYLDLSPLTEKDRQDLDFGLELGVDWVALSFVQHPSDIREIREIIGDRAAIMAKLEKPLAIEHLEEIVELSDGIMVARGDLGVELPPEDIPVQQKRIVDTCRRLGRPVVVATQMLESMVSAPTPTRAEASDVATAIYDGADAVMLSAETAVGKFPVEAVTIMSRIIQRIEQDPRYLDIIRSSRGNPETTASDAIGASARQTAETISAKAIVAWSSTGATTLRIARERPFVPVLGLTPNLDFARRSALIWGIQSVRTKDVESFAEMRGKSVRFSKRLSYAGDGDNIVIVAGIPFGTPGSTNIMHIADVD